MALGDDSRPAPPGDYDVVVVGSGPGGLQTSYFLGRLGIRHAVVSADEGPGGMFRRFPLFERLISWTHQEAEVSRGTRLYEAHDQNSLLAEEPELSSLVVEQMTEGRPRPTRREMELGLTAFAERAGLPVRYSCRWESTRRDGDGFVLTTTDGDYRCRAAVFALGMTEPWVPPVPGLEVAHHYVHAADDLGRYRNRRVAIVGKRNSAFEVGEAILRHGLRSLTLVSPRPADVGRLARSPLRPWYLTAYDEHVRGAPGRFVLDAAVERVERVEDGYRLHAVDPSRPEPILVDADLVIAATGFEAPLGDLPDLGLETVADGRLPALQPWFEGVGLPGAYFAGNITQSARGLRKHGVSSVSSMVCGHRYNARILVRHLAETVFGRTFERPEIPHDDAAAYLVSELTNAPEIALQKGYLARVLSREDGRLRDEGIVPLQTFVDGEGDGVAAALEFDDSERIVPVLYVRAGGALRESPLEPHPLRRYDGPEYVEEIEARLQRLTG